MSSSFDFRGVRHLAGAVALGLALVGGMASAAGAQSSPQDRARFVAITHNLEAAPLNGAFQADRQWALKWLTDAPDVSVDVCLDMLGGASRKDYPYAEELVFQYMFAMGAEVIEHPQTAQDKNALQLAGVDSALKAYQVILAAKPEARSSDMDALLAAKAQGRLPDLVQQAWARCNAKT